jgi:hypothetical protein
MINKTIKTATKTLTSKVKVPVVGFKIPMWAILGGGLAVLYQQQVMPSMLTPAPLVAKTSQAPAPPSVAYGYDAYPPLRNEPYYNTTQMFGPADGDPVFYGVPGWM